MNPRNVILVCGLMSVFTPFAAPSSGSQGSDSHSTNENVSNKDLAIIDFAADRRGSTASTSYFNSLFGAPIPNKYVPFGKYYLDADVTPPDGNLTFSADPGISFTGQGKLRLEKLIPFNIGPLFSEDLRYTAYGSEWNGYKNVFQTSRHIKTTSTTPVVAIYGAGEAAGPGSKAWGSNLAAIVTSPGGTGIASELDINMAAPGTGTAVSANAVGPNQATAAYEISANSRDGGFKYGLDFNNNGHTAISNGLIYGTNNSSANGIYLTGIFTNSEMTLPSFIVSATPPNLTTVLQVSGGNGKITIAAVGSAKNADIDLAPKNAGHVVAPNAVLRQGAGIPQNPGSIGDLAVEISNDTTLTFKVKGSDGVVRSASINLKP
jgi:hypothetical protein